MKQFTYKGLTFAVKHDTSIALDIICLDIETSNNHAEKPEDLITWISSIQVGFQGHYYLFRYPEELINFYMALYDYFDMKPFGEMKKRIITYIHNASYDLSYLIPYLNQLPDDSEEGFKGIIISPNKFISYIRGCFEFRCSYQLSGKSLEKWSTEMNVEHKKQVALYDYDKIIYPDDKLTENEEKYDKYDILSMQECISKQMEYFKDDITTIPLTSTGYIRRTLRRSCKRDKYYHKKYFYSNRISAELYNIALKSFAGGMTHNNRFYRDTVINVGNEYDYNGKKIKVKKIKHRDFKSHYPTQIACYDVFPTGKPQHIYHKDIPFNMTIDDILKDYPNFTSFCVIRFYEASLKDWNISIPFFQFSKCYEARFHHKLLDNGRILSAEGEWITYIDTLSLKILNEQYNLTYEILDVWRISNSKLPDCITDVVKQYFKGKSDYKNIWKDCVEQFGRLDERSINAEFDLMQQKKGLNSIYGCCATRSLKEKMVCTEEMIFRYDETFSNIEEMRTGIEEYYRKKNNFLQFTWGCITTSLARYELYEYIKAVGYEKVLYCDTDSIFYISDDDTEKAIAELNEVKRSKADFVTLDNGKVEYFDEFTEEPDCIAFKGLHSKCYGVVTKKGLEITIAGVPARTLIGKNEDGSLKYITREEELAKGEEDPVKALDHLTDGFKFHINTGNSALYVGATGYNTPRVPTILYIDGHEIHTAGGCVIRQLKEKQIKDIELVKVNTDNIEDNYDIESLK